MQDNFTPDINPEWAEEGWSGMKSLLDQEMPVANRRPVAWAWWTGAALLLGLGFFLFQVVSPSASTIGYFPVPVQGDQAAPLLAQETSASSGAVPAEAALAEPSQQPATAPPVKPHSATPALAPSSHDPNLTVRPAVDNPESSKHTTKAILARPATEDAAPKPIKSVSIAEVSRVPSLSIQPIAVHENTVAKLDYPTIPASQAHSWHFGILASGLYSPGQDALGYEAGGFLSWQQPGSKWYGRLNLTYQQANTNHLLEEQQFAFTNTRLAASGNSSALVTLRSQLETLQFANTALQAGYWLTPRLGLEMGLSMAYLVGAEQKNTWQSIPEPGSGGNGTDGSQEDFTGFNYAKRSDATTSLERWNTGLSAGVSYRINRTLFTTLQYRAPLGSLTQPPRPRLNNRVVALSLFARL